MTDRTKAIEECLDECTAIARNSSDRDSAGAWSCVRALHKMLLDEKNDDAKSRPSVPPDGRTQVRL